MPEMRARDTGKWEDATVDVSRLKISNCHTEVSNGLFLKWKSYAFVDKARETKRMSALAPEAREKSDGGINKNEERAGTEESEDQCLE